MFPSGAPNSSAVSMVGAAGGLWITPLTFSGAFTSVTSVTGVRRQAVKQRSGDYLQPSAGSLRASIAHIAENIGHHARLVPPSTPMNVFPPVV